jgi:hypothetical protein
MVDIAPFPITALFRAGTKIVQGDDPGLHEAFYLVSGIGGVGDKLIPEKSESLLILPGEAPTMYDKPDTPETVTDLTPDIQPILPDGAREFALKKLSPELEEQIANDLDVVTLDSKVISEQSEIIDGEKRDKLVVRQEVVDARYIEYGNLLDMTAKLRAGKIPTLDEIVLAIVDVLDAVTLEMIRPHLLRWKVESHKGIKDVNVTLSEMRSNYQKITPESIFTDSHKWKIEKPGTDVDLDVHQDISVQDGHESKVHAYQITFEHHDVCYGDTAMISNSGRVAHVETEGVIFEETLETRRTSESVTATANVEQTGQYSFSGPEKTQIEEKRSNRIYTTDKDISYAVKDGLLTQEELGLLNAHLVSEQTQPISIAEYEKPQKFVHLPSDFSGDGQPVTPSEIKTVQPVSLQNDKQAETFYVLQSLADQVTSDQPMSVEDGFEAGQAIGTVNDRNASDSVGGRPSSQTDSMVRSHADTTTDETSRITGISDVEKSWKPDHRVESSIKTKSTHTVQSDIQATQVSYTESVHSSGPLKNPAGETIIKKESRAIVVVNEAESTITTESHLDRTTSTVFGKDVGNFLGTTEKNGETIQHITSKPTQRVYEIRDQNVSDAIIDGQLSQSELNKLGARLMLEEEGDAIKKSQLIDSGGNVEYKEGWAEYIPMGSVISAGMKSSYGVELSGSDYFWAAVDSVGTLVTFGAGAAASAAFRTAGKGIAKGVMKGNLKTVGKAIVKGGQKGSEVLGHEMAQRSKEFLQVARTGEKIVENMAQGEFRKAGRIVAREAGQAGERVILQTRDQVMDAAESVDTIRKKTGDIFLGKKSVGSRSGKVSLRKNNLNKITNLQPNTETTISGYHYFTDNYGRVKRVKGKLDHTPGQRDVKNQVKAGRMGQPGDDGGHLIAAQFNGPGDAINVVPQNANLNRGEWKSMEMDWKRNLKEGKTVNVDIQPKYTGDSVRPSSFVVHYEVDGKMVRKTFTNEIPRDTITSLAAIKGSQEALKHTVQNS